MTLNSVLPVGVLVVAMAAIATPAEARQRDSRGRDRNPRAGQSQPRPSGGVRSSGAAPRAIERQPPRTTQPAPSPSVTRPNDYRAYANRDPRRDVAPVQGRAVPRYEARNYDRRGPVSVPRNVYRNSGPRIYNYRTYDYYRAPRIVTVPAYPRHYYGPGGNLSVYFGWGNGYFLGAPWSGRVYGYAPSHSYGARVYYGDVRLQVQPRDAAVYVDGYYAGVVDDFDGVFQRLTLEAGPHQIELDAPGLPPQFFDIDVDPVRTVTIHADLF